LEPQGYPADLNDSSVYTPDFFAANGLGCSAIPSEKVGPSSLRGMYYNENNCQCMKEVQCPPCDYISCPDGYDWLDCPYFSGPIHWSGCHMWLSSDIDGSLAYHLSFDALPGQEPWMAREFNGEVCTNDQGNQYHIWSDFVDRTLVEVEYGYVRTEDGEVRWLGTDAIRGSPDFWRFYEDPKWLSENGKSAMGQLETSLWFPNGPEDNAQALAWDFDFNGNDFGRGTPESRWFN